MNKEKLEALEQIRLKHGGVLHAKHLVEDAVDPKHPYHDDFTWNNEKAGHEHRLWQARELINVAVTVLKNSNSPIQAYVSLNSDRYNGGGYRSIVDVMSDKDLREQLLNRALNDLDTYRKKYEQLHELTPIFAAADKVRIKTEAA